MTATVEAAPTLTLTPPPTPLPVDWTRAIANDLANRLTLDGWSKYTEKRSLHPTGNPHTNTHPTPGMIPGPEPTTRIINEYLYTRGTISPDDYPTLDIPPLLWHLKQLDMIDAFTRRDDWRDLSRAADIRMRARRLQPLYRTRPNRHGRLRLKLNDTALPLEGEAFLLAASAATVWVVDPLEFEEATRPDFDGEAALRAIEEALGLGGP